jgi:MFS family permease
MFLPLVIYIQQVMGFSPTKAGVLTAPMSLLAGIVAPFIGRLSDKTNPKYLVLFGLFGLTAGLALFAIMARSTSGAWALVPGLLVCGLGIGSVFAPMSNATMGSVEPRLTGAASGIFNTARQVGGVLGSAATGVLLQARIAASLAGEHGDVPKALSDATRQTLILPMAVLVLGMFAAMAMRRATPRPQAEKPAQPEPAIA